ncbi:type II toxin-antitoxin system VapC family toxin [Caulobacter sp. BE254]|uniref:type II toxin-antitoxin system VapC family toxin n=1 Tax=Caulobacter sp. BE254 TaxID=2817720 RepID=UPI002856EB2B|nr:type II toxin-antitoxin system VapC family toxin [Caulobacter sp. BE254]MDR7116799.1 PIN domain nuclease of toxin-antitoxin system [Caulobacter sp. BE254]
MKLLLDTHALIWALAQSRRLPPRLAALLMDTDNDVLVSVACAYEIEFKRSRSAELGLLPADIEDAVRRLDFAWLPVDARHAVVAGRLPRQHGDPFDRLIAAQGLVENATVITRDPQLVVYGVPTLW